MSDINSYANDLLIEFLDASHTELKRLLHNAFGESWFDRGVANHLNSSALDRTREMLDSPMALVDMGKTDEELYGVEHLGSIVLGNWAIFGDAFGDRQRTEVYFGEITELRHNVSHRRQHNMLRRRDLLRFIRNAQLLLTAFDSSVATKFDALATTLEHGGSPWGNELEGTLPPAAEIVSEFVGRESEMRELRIWLMDDDARQFVIWGYGGSGKSALAYQFARSVRESAPSGLHAVVWLSAKLREYVDGETRVRVADFDSLESFGKAFWASLYGADPPRQFDVQEGILRELSATPLLLIVDDLDSVLDDEALAHFLLYQFHTTKSRILYTSRRRQAGLRTVEVAGFSDDELERFVFSRARYYEVPVDDCRDRITEIKDVTDGIPLFVDDLMRHVMLDGLNRAIKHWRKRSGDAARICTASATGLVGGSSQESTVCCDYCESTGLES